MLEYRDATELACLIASGHVSPVEAVEHAFAVLDETEPRLNAFAYVMREQALADARRAESERAAGAPLPPLHGVPVSIKDLIAVRGVPCEFGSRALAGNIASVDAPAVARLRRAGAIIIGKTSTSELGASAMGNSPAHGITRNPWNLSSTPGGSSAGAAASVAAGVTPIAIGTDGGGSIRIPAALTGVFGLKAQFGRVPVYPRSATPELAHVAPMTRSVRDAALALRVLAGRDARDPLSLTYPVPDYMRACSQPLRKFRVAWSPTYGYANPEPEVLTLVQRAVGLLSVLGCEVEIVEAPIGPDPAEAWSTLFYAGVAHKLEGWMDSAPSALDPSVLPWLRAARARPGKDFRQAVHARYDLLERLDALFGRYDLLVSPTLPIASAGVGDDMTARIAGSNPVSWAAYTYPFNLTGHPAASIPVGMTKSGHPVGMQLVGRQLAESDILSVATVFESAQPWANRKPPFSPA